MRRFLIGMVGLAASCLAFTTFGIPVAQASSPLTGRLVDAVAPGHPGVAAMVVRLRTVTSSGPGDVVASDVSGDKGFFSLDAGPAPADEYYVQVVAGTYQGGYIGGSPGSVNYVQPTAGHATTYGPHATLGNVRANPAYIRGTVVNSKTGEPVPGVLATVRDEADPSSVESGDSTNGDGVFRVTGITCEDSCLLKVNGSAKGYETGYLTCMHQVDALDLSCAAGPGRIGKVFLDEL